MLHLLIGLACVIFIGKQSWSWYTYLRGKRVVEHLTRPGAGLEKIDR